MMSNAVVALFFGLHGVAELSPLPLAESVFIFGYATICSLGPNDLVKVLPLRRRPRRKTWKVADWRGICF